MAKGDLEKLNSDVDAEKSRVQGQNSNYLGGIKDRLGSPSSTRSNGFVDPGTGLRGQQEQQLKQVTPQLQNFAGTGGISDQAKQDLGTGQGSISSQYKQNVDNAGNATFGPWGSIQGSMVSPDYGRVNMGYNELAATGGIDPTQARSTFSALQTGQGRADQDIINQLKDTTGRFGDVNDSISKLKGVDFSGVGNSISSLNDFSKTGGMSDADISNVNRPVFDEFEQTGGYSDQDKANIKKEANATVASNYGNLADAMNRQKASSGYGPNFGAAQKSMARQAAIASGDQDLSTNVNLSNAVRQGRMSAAQQKAANQLGISSITTPAKLAALKGAGDLGLGMTGQQSANLNNAGQLGLGETGQQISALGTAGDLSRSQGQLQLAAAQGDLNAQKAIQEGKIAGLGGLEDTETKKATYGLNKAGLLSDNAKTMLGAQGNAAQLASGNLSNVTKMEQEGKEYGTSGLAGLYNSSTAQISDADRNELAGMGLDENSMNQLLAIQQRASNQPGKNQQMFGNIMQGLGAGAGAMSGLGGMFGGR